MNSIQDSGYTNDGILYSADAADNHSEDYVESEDARAPFLLTKPLDRFKFVRLSFLLMGVALLLPWCFFVTANDFWMYKFRNVSQDQEVARLTDKTELQATFTSYLAITASGISIITLAVCPALVRRFSEWNISCLSLALMILLFILTTALVKVDTDSWQMGFFGLTMVIVIFLNGISSVFQSAVYAVAALLPPKYMYNNMIGQALAGVIAAVFQILSLMSGSSPSTSALFYFTSAILLLVLTFVCYVAIHYINFFKYYVARNAKPLRSPVGIIESTVEEPRKISATLVAARKMWPYLCSIFMILFVTLAVNPSVSVLVVSVRVDDPEAVWAGRYFLPICCFFVFNFSDVCGRMVAMWIVPPAPSAVLLVGSFLRLVFIPLVMLCNAHPRSNLPVLLDSDIYFVLVITLMGLTNGYLTSLIFFFATRDVPSNFKGVAGTVLSTAGGIGVLLGSLFSVVLIKLL